MYDVVIIGSGIGGLVSANILAKEGMKVCVLEKNKQIGGNLQTFSRNKQLFDSGVHYLGGLEKGQNLYQIFAYLGVIDRLSLEKMDEGFDRIMISGDNKEYVLSQGYDAFVKNLVRDFPDEESAIRKYCEKVIDTCSKFGLYRLSMEVDPQEKLLAMGENARDVIASLTSNTKLQAVLAGNNLLYSGVGDLTPFHVHALVTNSYIESSWKCVDGGSQIAKILAENIRNLGGDIIRNCEVINIVETNGIVTHVETEYGQKFEGKYFISNINPAATLQVTHSKMLRESYRKRIDSMENTVSCISIYAVLKERTILYKKRNYYYHKAGYCWNQNDYTEENWPLGYALFFSADRNDKNYASAFSVIAPMRFRDVEKWKDTYNRIGKENDRGEDYEVFKKRKIAQLLKVAEEKFPGISEKITHVYAATPLTNRDYIGVADGSMYGLQKDYRSPLKSMISPATKISNLFLTGQNLHLHGILGTSLSAILTCSMLLNDHSIVDKIRNA